MIVPEGKELLPFQLEGATALAERRAALLGDEPGLGKTVQAIAAANKAGARDILITCPANAKLVWKRHLESWLVDPRVIQVVNTTSDEIHEWSEIVIVNYDLLTYGLEYKKGEDNVERISGGPIYDQVIARRWDLGIFDEAHYMKTRDAARTLVVLQKNRIASRCAKLFFLSGTPLVNRPVELYPILRAAAPEVIRPYLSFTEYAKRYCDGWYEEATGIFWADGATNTKELNERLRSSGFLIRRLKVDVLPQLPPRRYQLVPLARTKDTEPLIEKEITWTHGDFARVHLDLGGEHIATHRRQVALAKLNQCVEYIVGELEAIDKLVVFAYHREVVQKLRTALEPYNPVVLAGGMTAKQKDDAEQRFQKDPSVRVFIGQVVAAGTAITLTAASNVIFVESSGVPGEIDQAFDRVHRIGQERGVLARFLVVDGSIEEYMLGTVLEKRKVIEEILE